MDLLASLVLVILSAITFIRAICSCSIRGKSLPPGPTRLPIIGNLHLLGNQPHKSMAMLAKKHGPLMSLQLGQVTTVHISSAAIAKEVLKTQDLAFSSHNIPDALKVHDHHNRSILLLPVAVRWRSLRKVINSSIFSGTCLDAKKDLRSAKVQELVDYCRKKSQAGETVELGKAAFRTSMNVLANTVLSKDLMDPSEESAELKDLVWNIMVEAGKPNLADFFPFLGRFDPQGIRSRMTDHFGKVLELFNGLINERLMENSHKGGSGDALDFLLDISQENSEEIDRTQIKHILFDLFTAGTETTSSTLEWAMAEALRNPETMKKAKAELEQVIGKGKIVEDADLPRLPYLCSMVKETLRIHQPAPFLAPRKVYQDVQLYGYTVPKGSQVLVNAWAIQRDESTWESPLEFKPERFLDSEMDVRGKDFELIPFGAGRRICPGLPLAMKIVPVMLGSLLNTFDWEIEGGMGPEGLDMEEKFGFTLQKAIPLRAIPILL